MACEVCPALKIVIVIRFCTIIFDGLIILYYIFLMIPIFINNYQMADSYGRFRNSFAANRRQKLSCVAQRAYNTTKPYYTLLRACESEGGAGACE